MFVFDCFVLVIVVLYVRLFRVGCGWLVLYLGLYDVFDLGMGLAVCLLVDFC